MGRDSCGDRPGHGEPVGGATGGAAVFQGCGHKLVVFAEGKD